VRAFACYDETLPEPLVASPCLAALTPSRSLEQKAEILTQQPDLSWLGPDTPLERRFLALDLARDHFMCTSGCLDIGDALESLLRSGYLLRHAPDKDYHKKAEARRQALLRRLHDREPQQVKAISIGGSLLGPAGSGKSSTVRAFLAAGPQVIVHQLPDFDGAAHEQLVFVIVSAPSNGSMKSFCRRFLRQADAVLGTAHAKVGHANKDDLIQLMADVADANTLGLLVLDHAENLVTEHGFATEIITDLTAIVDTLHIPLLLIGTPQTKPLWEASESLGRRLAMHSFEWQPMTRDEQWDEYVNHLLELQILPNSLVFSREFADMLWDKSQGVLDVANALFFKVQWYALKNKKSSMSLELLEQVADHEMPTIMAEVERLRRLSACAAENGDSE
jgi:type II secretory pathway predicted ATPase ExeA